MSVGLCVASFFSPVVDPASIGRLLTVLYLSIVRSQFYFCHQREEIQLSWTDVGSLM